MPYRIRWEGHGVYRRFFGVTTARDFKDAYDEIVNDIRYEGIRYVISDFLEAQQSPDVSEQHAAEFAEFERLKYYSSPDIVNATVATDEGILALVRHYESTKASPYPLGIFSTVAEARKWIAANPRLGWNRPVPVNAATANAQHG